MQAMGSAGGAVFPADQALQEPGCVAKGLPLKGAKRRAAAGGTQFGILAARDYSASGDPSKIATDVTRTNGLIACKGQQVPDSLPEYCKA